MNIPSVFWLVPIASIVALSMAYFFFRSMMKADEGTPRMKEIALYVRKGAMAYLKQQYKVVCIVFVVLCALFAFMAYGLNVQTIRHKGEEGTEHHKDNTYDFVLLL